MRRRVRSREFPHGLRGENSFPVELAIVEHHFRKERQIVSSRKKPRVSRNATHVARCWIVDNPQYRRTFFDFRRRDPVALRGRRIEAALRHPQRLKYQISNVSI